MLRKLHHAFSSSDAAASLTLAARLSARLLPSGGVCPCGCSSVARLWRPGNSTRCCRHPSLSAPTLSGTRSLRLPSATARRDDASALVVSVHDSSAAALAVLPPPLAPRAGRSRSLPLVGLGETATRTRARAAIATGRWPRAPALLSAPPVPTSLRLLQEGAFANALAPPRGFVAALSEGASGIAATRRLARVLKGGAGVLRASPAAALPSPAGAASPVLTRAVGPPALWPGPTRLSSARRGF
jgi:hypothetical protein